MILVERNTVDRTYLLALWRVEMTDALGAFVGIDNVDFRALINRFVGALGFADIAVDAVVGN